ncbi:MAG TPA: alanine racemase, partial [Ilumatobacteraceae bacterium]|nr:alanine racemase [Ilumatobacteraceae bacterium]
VQRAAWEAHIDGLAATVDGLVPVVKGNGYGFGRATLHPLVKGLSDFVCVGTIYELDHVGDRVTPIVLTPTVEPPISTGAVPPILTIGSISDVRALRGWRGRVIVKLQSSMRRFGATPDEVDDVVASAAAANLELAGYALHLPLAGSEHDRLVEVDAWLNAVDPDQPLWLSHLSAQSYGDLRARLPDRQFRLRLGTALWHGDKSFLKLTADVLAVHPVRGGDCAGYQLTDVPGDGQVVLVSAGSAHGVAPLPNGASPFHFARTRLAMLEPPHMHTSMVFVPEGQQCPGPGDRVDVQRPLISTLVDRIDWI